MKNLSHTIVQIVHKQSKTEGFKTDPWVRTHNMTLVCRAGKVIVSATEASVKGWHEIVRDGLERPAIYDWDGQWVGMQIKGYFRPPAQYEGNVSSVQLVCYRGGKLCFKTVYHKGNLFVGESEWDVKLEPAGVI